MKSHKRRAKKKQKTKNTLSPREYSEDDNSQTTLGPLVSKTKQKTHEKQKVKKKKSKIKINTTKSQLWLATFAAARFTHAASIIYVLVLSATVHDVGDHTQ